MTDTDVVEGPSARVVKLVDQAYLELFVLPSRELAVTPVDADFRGVYREKIIDRVMEQLHSDSDHEDDMVPRKAVAMAVDLTHQGGLESWEELRRERLAAEAAIDLANRLIDISEEFYETRSDDRVEELYDEATRLMVSADDAMRIISTSQFVRTLGVSPEALEEVRGLLAELRPTVEAARSRRREADRQERIAARRTPDVKMDGTRCACGKPARIDGWCKKCARANGIIVHGKIGEA